MPRLAAIGECMIELSRSKDGAYNLGFGGDSLNASLYFARWGGRVDYVTAIGDDPYSGRMYDAWQADAIGVELVQIVPGRQSGLYMIETDDRGERNFSYWRDNAPARDIFEFESCDNLLKSLMSHDFIYFSGITLSLYSDNSLDIFHDFLKKYKENGGKIIFDLNYRAAGWPGRQHAREVFDRFIPLINIALPSQEDEEELTGERNPAKIIKRYSSMGVAEIVVKCGKDGCVLNKENTLKNIPTDIIQNPLDTTAAGDAFNGGYMAARLSGLNSEQAVFYGQKTAALVIQHTGAIVSKNDWPEDYKIL